MRLPCLHLGTFCLPARGLVEASRVGERLVPLSSATLERFQPQRRSAGSSRAPKAQLRASALDTETTEPAPSSQGGQARVSDVQETVPSATLVLQNLPGRTDQAFVSSSALK